MHKRDKYLIAAFRKVWRWDEERAKVLKQVCKKHNKYVCYKCNKEFTRKNVVVDHINPVVAVEGWKGWNNYYDRLFVRADKLQVLCKLCHRKKTNLENLLRKKEKNKNAI